MIIDKTIDDTILELARTMKALTELKKVRSHPGDLKPWGRGGADILVKPSDKRQHAAALRAAMDLKNKLSDLRQGR